MAHATTTREVDLRPRRTFFSERVTFRRPHTTTALQRAEAGRTVCTRSASAALRFRPPQP
ncbi:MAG: hypothetical protein BGO98_07735 [Myxococcales bacterium 68-20]|nr:MAG: hypothetical protein BGO98_07735 [Myxococcales bacterium 68-20]